MKKVLVVVDMQYDFITGALGTIEAQDILPLVAKKIKNYHNIGYPVYFTKDTHKPDYLNTQEGKNLPIEHCIIETRGWGIHASLDPEYASDILIKNTFGYPNWKEFFVKEEQIGIGTFDVEEIELIGVCTDICVISNALILKSIFPEVKITVDATCCAGTTPEKHKMALEVMKSCQINIINAI